MGYFYDDNGNIHEELLDQKAEKQARDFIIYRQIRQDQVIDKQKSLTSAQLRRFYGEFRQLKKKADVRGFDKVRPLIKMVKSKASYAANPSNRKIPESFKKFLIENINRIDSGDDFKAFMLHFEAVVGFYYGMGVSNN